MFDFLIFSDYTGHCFSLIYFIFLFSHNNHIVHPTNCEGHVRHTTSGQTPTHYNAKMTPFNWFCLLTTAVAIAVTRPPTVQEIPGSIPGRSGRLSEFRNFPLFFLFPLIFFVISVQSCTKTNHKSR